MLPRRIPLPVLVVVMVRVLAEVLSVPAVMFIVPTETLFASVTVFVEEDLFTVMVAKVVAPVIVASVLPVKEMVLVPPVNVPLLTQFPCIIWV